MTITEKREYNNTRYRLNREKGKCGRCGKEPALGRTQCSDCLLRAGNTYWNRVAEGRCTECGVDLNEDMLRCANCRKTDRRTEDYGQRTN